MANIQVLKANHSFYIINLFDANEQIQYDWSVSKSYTVIVGTGTVSIGTDITPAATRTGIGLYKVPAGEKMICSAEGGTPAFTVSLFSLADSVIMPELFPTGSTLTQINSTSSNFIDFAFENSIYKVGNQFTYNTSPGNVTITLNDLNAKVLEGLSS